ncbi:MAG: hypothetical protein AABY22_20290, partial [Nanoarchaeota archaeon]
MDENIQEVIVKRNKNGKWHVISKSNIEYQSGFFANDLKIWLNMNKSCNGFAAELNKGLMNSFADK